MEQLFEDDGSQPEFKINEKFAQKFEHNKRRQLMDKAEQKFGKEVLEASSEESSEDEDEDADLLNPKVEKKFIEMLTMIKKNDPKLKEINEIFKDEDFEEEASKNKKGKVITYKDQVRQDVLDREEDQSSDNEEQVFQKKRGGKETIFEEEQRLKKEFKMAAEEKSDEEDEFIKKVEDSEDDNGDQNVEEMDLEEILKKKKKKKEANIITDVDLMKRFYKDN